MIRRANRIFQQQNQVLLALGTGVLVIVVAVSWFILDDSGSRGPIERQRSIDLPADKVNPQELWMAQADAERKLMKQRMDQLEALSLEYKKREEQEGASKEVLQGEVSRLRHELEAVRQTPMVIQNDPFAYSSSVSPDPYRSARPQLLEVVMDKPSRSKVLNVEQVVPAGTTVRALLVSSVDASCGIGAASDPQPVKLRILDDGHLPKSVMAKLKGGLIIASAYGNLSSERVYMRIERMTQTKSSGDFVETAVTGFVTGEDGKFGIRGVVADRSDKLVKSAAISGFFSGISQFLQATTNAQDIRDATRGLPNSLRWDIVKDSGLNGAGNAMDKLSEYYIRRAEQLQPVIQVAAGRIVDITFTHGAAVGDLHTQDKVRQIRESTRDTIHAQGS